MREWKIPGSGRGGLLVVPAFGADDRLEGARGDSEFAGELLGGHAGAVPVEDAGDGGGAEEQASTLTPVRR